MSEPTPERTDRHDSETRMAIGIGRLALIGGSAGLGSSLVEVHPLIGVTAAVAGSFIGWKLVPKIYELAANFGSDNKPGQQG